MSDLQSRDHNEIILDHPPTPEELAGIFQSQDVNDPRSLLYQRTLLRPKIPVVKILLSIIFIAALCWGSFEGTLYLFQNPLCAVGCAVAIGCLLCILFAKRILITMVRIYQAVAPKKLRSRCRYEPSCSAYMILALEKYGAWKGFRKGLKRWQGCKPPNGGYDFP